jgi:peptidase M41-like protein
MDRLPRIRPRPPRHAYPRRRPGPQDLDHPLRVGARRHLPSTPDRPVWLLHRLFPWRITGALGGRVAEEVVYGDVTTGAENALEQASDIARQMVGRRGTSPGIGPVSVLPAAGLAPATRGLVDTEARRIIEECYERPLATLRCGRDRLDRLAHTLTGRETLDEAYAAAGIRRDTAPPRSPTARQENHRGNQEWRCQAADAAAG